MGVFGGCDASARLAAAQFYLRGCNATQLGRFTLCQTRQFRATNTGARERPNRSIHANFYVTVKQTSANEWWLWARAPSFVDRRRRRRRLPQFTASFPSVAVSLRRHTGHESLVLSHSRMHDSP